MKTIILIVNGRESFGERAKELFVGAYHVGDESLFKKSLEEINDKLNKGDWISPRERPLRLMSELSLLGYVAVKSEQVFVALF